LDASVEFVPCSMFITHYRTLFADVIKKCENRKYVLKNLENNDPNTVCDRVFCRQLPVCT